MNLFSISIDSLYTFQNQLVDFHKGSCWDFDMNCAKTGLIKDRNGLYHTEAEDIKKRWQEYTEELYRKDLHDPDNHDDVITNLEPDVLESEVKWALESITANQSV